MLRILIADGTPAAMQVTREAFGILSNFSLFEAALRTQQPNICCASINVADGQDLPQGVSLCDFDGCMLSGSPLHVYDRTLPVTRQIDFARAAFAAGMPVWGSCWGLQLATVALGGSVRRNPRGPDLGVARAITTTAAGRSHPLLATRPPVFDSLCSHIDELEHLPSSAQVLAQNELCPVQALTLELPHGGSFFGTQYHPEHTLSVSAGLIEIRADSLVEEGLGRDRAELVAMADDFRALDADPERRDLAWRYGIGPEILDPVRRTAEIGNWLRQLAKISSS
ncbi:MAG: type 1 glutamine amidotransferase [Alphaproteobacteria bacterium]|nr:type 1 glutamine amidotransferase [Alphaproteobacteria bacterium]